MHESGGIAVLNYVIARAPSFGHSQLLCYSKLVCKVMKETESKISRNTFIDTLAGLSFI